MTGNLIASALPPLDSSTLPYYAVLAYGAVRGGAKVYEWVTAQLEKRRKGHAEEVGRATEGATRTRAEAENLIAIQDKTISRLTGELAEAEHKAAEAKKEAEGLRSDVMKLDAKLASAGRQWFEREGFINELERRLEALENERRLRALEKERGEEGSGR